MIVQCPNCGSKNRVDPDRATQAVCGKCGKPLPPVADSPVDVTDATFADEVLKSPVPVLVDCWAAWCGPCRQVAPSVDELAKESAGRWKVTKLNTDQNPQTAARLRIEGIPALFVFKAGQVVDQLVGAYPKPAIEAMVKKHV